MRKFFLPRTSSPQKQRRHSTSFFVGWVCVLLYALIFRAHAPMSDRNSFSTNLAVTLSSTHSLFGRK